MKEKGCNGIAPICEQAPRNGMHRTRSDGWASRRETGNSCGKDRNGREKVCGGYALIGVERHGK